MGTLDADVTRGVRKILDEKGVTFTRTAEGRIHIGGIPVGDNAVTH